MRTVRKIVALLVPALLCGAFMLTAESARAQDRPSRILRPQVTPPADQRPPVIQRPSIRGQPGPELQLISATVAPSAWVARHGLMATQYQGEFDKWAGQGYRLTWVSGYSVNGASRYAAIWEKKTGPAWVARHGLTAAQYQAEFDKHAAHGYRLVLVNGYRVDGGDRYAAIWEKASGPAWVARHGMTAAQYQAEFDQRARQGYRLKHVSAYSGRYAAIWEKASGPAWVAKHGLTAAQYQSEFDKWAGQGYRLARISGDGPRYTAIWEKSSGPGWIARHGLTAPQYQAEFEKHVNQGYRLVLVDGYTVNGGDRYAAIWVDEANAESRRLRDLLNQAYDNPQFGDKIVRGFLVKEVGGGTLAEIAANLRFQPLSTLKLLPYLHAIVEVDAGRATLGGTTVSWVEATQDNPNTNFDERAYASCLQPGSPGTTTGTAALEDALPTMMWESHNRTLDALLEDYGPDNITDRAHDLGLGQTEMHFGCPQGNVSAPWAANRSTLYDLARLFEGVERLEFVSNASSRDAFFDNMINLDYDGAAYMSPITGATVGPLSVTFLRDLVKREAGPAKQGIVEDFLKRVVLRGKGGSGGPSSDEFGYSDFLHVTLPFKQNGQIALRTFVVGWFVYGLKTPSGCPESEAGDGGTCQEIWKPERDALGKFKTEIHAAPIRMALKTW